MEEAAWIAFGEWAPKEAIRSSMKIVEGQWYNIYGWKNWAAKGVATRGKLGVAMLGELRGAYSDVQTLSDLRTDIRALPSLRNIHEQGTSFINEQTWKDYSGRNGYSNLGRQLSEHVWSDIKE